jgi:hypothetical protein
MTVKELKEKLNQFDDDFIVLVPNRHLYTHFFVPRFVRATNVAKGISGADGYILIDNHVEDDEI